MNSRHEIYEFADLCSVGIGEACDRAGIARSTPPRWKAGTEPRRALFNRLRQAVIEIARERGTLPPELQHVPAPADLPAGDSVFVSLRTIITEAEKIESVLRRDRGA